MGNAGGIATAKKLRAEAMERYLINPSICEECGKEIPLREKSKVSEIRRKRFCNQSCAATCNNRVRKKEVRTRTCSLCDQPFSLWRLVNGNWSPAKYCPNCVKTAYKGKNTLGRRTKGDVFSAAKNWQSAASTIREHARKAYRSAERTRECLICGYKKHTDICHLRGVSEFPACALVSEINALENLLALCPNHHWELDNGLLEFTKSLRPI